MFIIKNAYKSIIRTKGRNILVGIIILTIMAASCIALSIRSAAEIAKESGLQGVQITATITVDQEKMRSNMTSSGSTGPSRIQMPQLTLSDYEKYSDFSEVGDFYYTEQISMNKSGDEFAPYSDSSTSTNSNQSQSSEGRGPGGGKNLMMSGMNADFSVTGYSSDQAMSAFYKDKTSQIADGTLFDFDDAKVDGVYEAIINKTLAVQNGIKVGDTFQLTNSANSAEVYTFKLVGTYENSADESNTNSMAGFQTPGAMKAENAIYVNTQVTDEIVEESKKSPVETQDPMGNASTSTINNRVNATYVFTDVDSYNKFVEDVKAAGLSDNFKVYSSDVDNFDKAIVPMENLSKFATTLLLIILLIGGIILIVLTLFNIRERKYEVGVYTGIGIRKPKVAAQFAVEILLVTLIAVACGAGIGAVASKPVSNAMLESQVQAVQQEQEDQKNAMGGRQMGPGPSNYGRSGAIRAQIPGMPESSNKDVEYVDSADATLNLMVILELVGIGILLAALSSLISVSFVMRYEPLQILADRS